MSKYIKLEGALKAVRDNTMPLDCWHIDRMRAIVDLPIIEINEEQLTSLNICEYYYKGYCSKYDDGCFHQCKQKQVSEDAISREYLKSFAYINKGDFNSAETIREWIDNAPNVVPGRAEGKWVKQGLSPYEGVQRCSLCGNVYNITEDFNYCPNCGAKMKKGTVSK